MDSAVPFLGDDGSGALSPRRANDVLSPWDVPSDPTSLQEQTERLLRRCVVAGAYFDPSMRTAPPLNESPSSTTSQAQRQELARAKRRVRVRRRVVASAGELLTRWLAPPTPSSFATALPASLTTLAAPANLQLQDLPHSSTPSHDPQVRELRTYTMGVLSLPPLARLIETYVNHASTELGKVASSPSLSAAQVTTTVSVGCSRNPSYLNCYLKYVHFSCRFVLTNLSLPLS